MTNQNLVHFKGTVGGEKDGVGVEVIEVTSAEIVVVVDGTGLCDEEVAGTGCHSQALAETADDLHLLVEAEMRVPKKRAGADAAAPPALGVGAAQMALVKLFFSIYGRSGKTGRAMFKRKMTEI